MKTIRIKLLCWVLSAAFLVLLFLCFYNYGQMKGTFLENYSHNQVKLAQLNAEKINSYLNNEVKMLEVLTWQPAINNLQAEAINHSFHNAMSQDKEILDIYLATEKGNFFDANGWVPPADYDAKQREWYLGAIEEGKTVFTTPYVDADSDKPVVTLAKPLYDEKEKIQGVLAADILFDKLLNMVSSINVGKDAYVFLTASNGLTIIHPNKKLMMHDNILQQKNESLRTVGEKMTQGKTGYGVYTVRGERRVVAYAPIAVTGWSLAISLPESAGLVHVQTIFWQNILIGLLSLLVLAVLLWFIAFYLTKPIPILTAATQSLAQGDLRQHLQIKSQDELGFLGEQFNLMSANLRSLLEKINVFSSQLTNNSKEIVISSQEGAKSVGQIAQTIEEIAQGAGNQAINAQNGAGMLGELVEHINQVKSESQKVHQLAESSLQLSDNGLQSIKKQQEAMDKSRNSTEQAAEAIDLLGQRSQEIASILDTITSIADQTNLLALNAAIEAARAGEQGRGFAVVAEEVRQLAEESNLSARQIGKLVKDVQLDIAKAVQEMKLTKENMLEQLRTSEETEKSFTGISQAVFATKGEIDFINERVDKVQGESRKILDFMQEISAVAQQNAAGAEEISASAQEQTRLIDGFASLAEGLNDLAYKLHGEVEKFKI